MNVTSEQSTTTLSVEPDMSTKTNVVGDNVKMETQRTDEEMLDTKTKTDERCVKKTQYFVPDLNECLNKYVIVNFNGRHYPGLVQDVDNAELEVSCMHQVGSKRSSNRFYWPRRKDVSFYNYDDIMTIIPEPIQIPNSRNYTIDEDMFQCAQINCM